MNSRITITVEHFLKVLEEMADKGKYFDLSSEMDGQIFVKVLDQCANEILESRKRK